MKISDPLSKIPFIGDRYEAILFALGIENMNDLLHYYPRKYHDSSKIYKVSELSKEEKRSVVGKLIEIKSRKTRTRITIQKALFISGSENLSVTWFNQPFLENTLKPDKNYLLFGKLNPKVTYLELLSPEVEELSMETKHIGRISPVYALTAGIKNKWLRARIKWLLDKFEYIVDFKETQNSEILAKYNLLSLKEALFQIHFPEDEKKLSEATHRLSFDEMLEIQKKIIRKRNERKAAKGERIEVDRKLINKLKKNLPFKLTDDQESSINEILENLTSTKPMDRLLQGDVGSGKTIVAAIASFAAQSAGWKVAYMAPTTILSEQIYKNFKQVLPDENIVLINSTHKSVDKISDNTIIIGTHAILFMDQALLNNLNLMIIDEEHRFGVKQREQLLKLEKETHPHKLSMTATPIPRSLAMTIWGDTDISYIRSMPKNRKQVQTLFVPKSKKAKSVEWIRKQMKESGIQTFWVCPIIEESEILNAKSAEETFKQVKRDFPELKVHLVHGKTKNKEIEIEKFKNKEFDILVTTPIIEVGIDIPNANLIVIESSERFGLAQLHQFRGRVGRGDKESFCLLFSTLPDMSQDQKDRLKYFCNTTDGLKLAEYDLKRRGPGEVYGVKQSGVPELKLADIFDKKLLSETREAAEYLFENQK